MNRNKRILLVAETLRLSNAARLATLGKALHEAGYHVVLAADPRCRDLVGELPFRVIPIRSALSREEITARWRSLMPLFDVDTLERYVREDIRLMRTVMPDLVIGDMRPSLPISARSQGVRFAVVADATFSADCTLPFSVTHLPFTDVIGRGPAQSLFDALVPLGMFVHALPVNMARLNHGIGGWHQDVRQTYTDGDLVIYPNIPDIVPMRALPPTHKFIGPVLWTARTPDPAPEWWDKLPAGPIVWANLSVIDQAGPARAVLDGLSGLGVTVVVSTAPDNPLLAGRSDVYAAANLRSQAMAARADLQVTTADTTAIELSLVAGTPVLVVPEPTEALTYAHAVQAKGAAEVMEGHAPDADAVRLVATRMLAEPQFAEAARALGVLMANYDSAKLIVEFVDHALIAKEAVAA